MGSVVATLVVVFCFGLLLQDREAKANLYTYVESRLMHRIAVAPTVEYRWATLEMLVSNMLGPLIISLVLVLLTRKQRTQEGLGRYAIVMVLIGLSGVAPLMLTMVQKSFYMAAALPIVAMAIALWSAPSMNVLIQKLRSIQHAPKVLLSIGSLVGLAAVIVGIALFGKPSRDADLLQDVHEIGKMLPPKALVGIPPEMWDDWNMQTYFMRYYFISFSADTSDHKWRITRKGMSLPTDLDHVRAIEGTRTIELWESR